jgi:flagellar motility protein MotE (MotC chaperone)
MGFFSRNKDSKENKFISQLPALPDTGLPELPQMPENQEEEIIQPLPKFPESSMGNSIGLQAIKSNVGFKPKFTEEINDEKEKRTFEIQEPEKYSRPQTIEKPYSMGKEPIFIKLDKFKDAIEKFEEIKEKVKDIDNSIKDIKDIKEKEDQELKTWEQEVQMIKEKVANIDCSLFSKI